jgi:uncharacterized protein
MARDSATMAIEVAYSPRSREVQIVALQLPLGSTVSEAVAASGLPGRHGLSIDQLGCSVWGLRCNPQHALREGDRVELCRALTVDPKEARRQRYKGQRAGRKEKRPAGAGR